MMSTLIVQFLTKCVCAIAIHLNALSMQNALSVLMWHRLLIDKNKFLYFAKHFWINGYYEHTFYGTLLKCMFDPDK